MKKTLSHPLLIGLPSRRIGVIMNHELIIKMMKLKKQEYEIFKEIMPEKVKSRINNMENEMVDIMKDFAFTEFTESSKEKKNSTEDEKKVKKVVIES